jgi:hypothetical protein
MLFHSPFPLSATVGRLVGVRMREGVVERSEDQGWCARPDLKDPRQLIVRGMPLKEMHLRPISRISSAVVSGVSDGVWEGARSCRMSREAGELRVNVAAAFVVATS